MANVKIKSSQPGLRNMSSCEDYAGNLYGRWPFTPKETYQVELPGLEPVTITHEVTWHTLTFHSPLFSKRLIKSMSICDTNLTTTAATPTTTTTTATSNTPTAAATTTTTIHTATRSNTSKTATPSSSTTTTTTSNNTTTTATTTTTTATTTATVEPHDSTLMRLPVKYNSTHPDEMTFTYTLGQGRDLTSTDLQKLKKGLLHLHITTTAGKEFYPEITLRKSLYEPGVYHQHSAPYTKGGWLAGPQFVGDSASYPVIAWGFNNCSSTSRHYISRLHPSAEGHHNNSLGHDTLAVTFMDSRAVISATFVGLSEPLTTVRFVGPDLAGK
ncbi:hypothetical protein Ahia01_001289400 [Argonauta hians]